MYYISTRDAALRCTASQAIVQGLSRDGGLFLPERIPALEQGALEKMKTMPYAERAVQVMKLYLEEFTEDELRIYADRAYGPDKFDTPAVAPLKRLDGGTAVLELWHGPTCAFKRYGASDAAVPADGVAEKDGRGKDGLHSGCHLRRHRKGRARGLPRR